MGFEDELKTRRASIAAEIEALRGKVVALEGVLAAYDAVLIHCDPDAVPAAVTSQPRRRTPMPLPPELQRLNKTEAVLEALREAGRPISTAECVSAIAARLGVAPSHEGLRRFLSHVSATLGALVRRERVRQATAVDGRTLLWEVAV